MDDIRDRDLSSIPDQDLTPEERAELQRRMDEFVDRMELRRPDKPGKAAQPDAKVEVEVEAEPEPDPKAKRYMNWDPAAIARRH